MDEYHNTCTIGRARSMQKMSKKLMSGGLIACSAATTLKTEEVRCDYTTAIWSLRYVCYAVDDHIVCIIYVSIL